MSDEKRKVKITMPLYRIDSIAETLHLCGQHKEGRELEEALLKCEEMQEPSPRQPLTDEQIDNLLVAHGKGDDGFHSFARAIEKAHGIEEAEQ